MKKFIAIAASAVLAISMFGFAACNNSGSEGEIKGNYSAPTAEELDSAINSIDMDKAFGDGTTDTGFEVLSKLSMAMSNNATSINLDTELGYKLVLGENKALGNGSASVKLNSKNGGTETSGEYAATVYNDAQWAYAEITGFGETPLKGKIDFNSLIAPDYPENPDAGQETVPMAEEILPITKFDAATLIQMCETYKIDLGLDNSDGLKIKASVTADTVWALLAEANVTAEDLAEFKELVTFNSFKLDAYLAFDKDGFFSQASLVMDIDVKIDGDKIAKILEGITGEIPELTIGAISGEMSYKINGYIAVKAYGGEVTLPEGIATDATYPDMTDMLGGLI